MRIYADTSIFDELFDLEFVEASKAFFEEVDNNRITLVTSAVVAAAKIEPAPDKVKELFSNYEKT